MTLDFWPLALLSERVDMSLGGVEMSAARGRSLSAVDESVRDAYVRNIMMWSCDTWRCVSLTFQFC